MLGRMCAGGSYRISLNRPWHTGTNGSPATESIESRIAKSKEMVSLLETNKYIIITPIYKSYTSEINEAYALEFGEHFFDLRKWWNDSEYEIDDYVYDGTHFTGEGNTIHATAIYQKLKELNYI